MKILHIPPRFLDDTTLALEQDLLIELYKRVGDARLKTFYPEDDRLFWLYNTYPEYLFMRLVLVNKECLKREITDYTVDYNEYLELLPEKCEQYDFSLEDVQRDISILTLLWEEYQEIEGIGEYLAELLVTDPEQIYAEYQWNLSLIKMEYEL